MRKITHIVSALIMINDCFSSFFSLYILTLPGLRYEHSKNNKVNPSIFYRLIHDDEAGETNRGLIGCMG